MADEADWWWSSGAATTGANPFVVRLRSIRSPCTISIRLARTPIPAITPSTLEAPFRLEVTPKGS